MYHCLRTIRQLRKWAWNDSSVSIHHEQPNPSPRILRISLRQTIQCKYTSKNEDRHLCVQLYGSSILSSAEGLFLRAKIKIQTLSLPNTFSQYSMRQWCMKTGLQMKVREISRLIRHCGRRSMILLLNSFNKGSRTSIAEYNQTINGLSMIDGRYGCRG